MWVYACGQQKSDGSLSWGQLWAGSCWLRASPCCLREQFQFYQEMLCLLGLLPKSRDKLERRIHSIGKFEVKMEVGKVLFQGDKNKSGEEIFEEIRTNFPELKFP